MSNWILLAVLLALAAAQEKFQAAPQKDQKDQRLSINFYYSSMCPFSQRYLKKNLANAVNAQGIWQIVDFRLVPYGITRRMRNGRDWEFDCMHGPSQCTGNLIHACAVELYRQQYHSKAIPYAICLAKNVRGWDYLGKECAQKVGVDWQEIRECSKSQKGRALLAEMGEENDKLSPKNTYVPWMTINGRHSQVLETEDLVEQACKRYRGAIKLRVCQQLNQQLNTSPL